MQKYTKILWAMPLAFAMACSGGKDTERKIMYDRSIKADRDFYTDSRFKPPKKYIDIKRDGTLDMFTYGNDRILIIDNKPKFEIDIFPGETVFMRNDPEAQRLQDEFDAVRKAYVEQEKAKK